MIVYHITFISHARLKAYGVNNIGLNLILNYLSNYRQRTEINTSLSDKHIIMIGVLERTILGSLRFNILFNDIVFSDEEQYL